MFWVAELVCEEIPLLIQTLSEKVNHFSGSLEDRKELLQEVTDATSSVLRAQSSSRETVAKETTFDLSSGVTDGLKNLIDVKSTDLSPMEQLIQEKKEQERLKARVIGETRDLLELLDAAADRLLEEAPPEGESTYFRSDGVMMAVRKGIPDVGMVPIGQDVGSVVFTKEDNLPEGSTMKVVAFVKDPFVWSVEKTEVSSSVVMVTITKDTDDVDGNPSNITVIVKQKVQFGITSDTEKQYHETLPTSYRQNLADAGSSSFPLTKVPDVTDMTYHAMYISDVGQVPLIRFTIGDVDSELQVYIRFHDFPTEEDYDYTTTVKPPEVTDYDGFDMPYGLVYSSFNTSIVPEIQKERGWLFVGVKRKGGDLRQTGLRRLLTSAVRATAPPADSAGFVLQSAVVSCLLREMDNHTWDSRSCKVGVQTNEDTTLCTCDMTRHGRSSRVTLATSFLAVPNFVDFDKFGSNIDKLSTNYTVFGTILALWMVFLVSQLLTLQINIRSHAAMATAVADSFALGQAARLATASPRLATVVPKVSTIPSEVPGADYVYVVCVRTGTQPDAGTASVVGLMVTGSAGRTPMATLNPHGLVLARGGDTYHIMSTPSSIGQLQSVQVWHDGSGEGNMESLFIDNIKVWDTQTSQGFYFPCNAWLSSSKGDGRTIRTMRAASDGEMWMSEYNLPTFSYLLYDDHLLLSAVCNSGVRHFSRAQRMVCCLTQITLWMVGSTMWYGFKLGAGDVVLLDAGFVTFRLSELAGVAATSFTVFLPVYAILVPMFRTQRPLVDQIPSGLYETPTSPSTWRFPFKTVAWILAVLTSVGSSLFVIVYSLQFGAERSQAWLKDFVLAFMFSTFAVEPIQIFLIAYSKAVIIGPIVGNLAVCVRGVFGKNLSGKEERPPLGDIQRKSRGYDVPARRVLPPAPKKTHHDPNWTDRMTQGRNILVLLVFLLIFTGNAFYIGVLGFDRHAYYVRTSLENSLLSGHDEVTTADSAWEWLSSDLMPSLHPERGYSGKTLRWLDKQFPVGTNAFRIGPVRLDRTTEYKEDPIDIDLEHSGQKLYPELQMFLQNKALGRQIGRNCSNNGTTSIANEVRNGTSACFSTIDLPQDADQAAAVIDFLKQTNWILMVSDTLTLRINFYHPDAKLFSTMAITLQYLPGGAAEMQPTIQTFRLFQYETSHDFVQMIFHIVFVLVYIYNLLTEILNVQKSGRLYFCSFWNILMLCNIGMSTAVIVTFALRYIQTAAALSDIQQAKGLLGIHEFVDISAASQWDATFKAVLSFSIFISTVSILRVLNFSRGVATVYALPRLIYGEAFGFSVYMLVVIVAYSFSGILIFGKNMESFSGFKKTSYVLFEMGLGRPFDGVFADDMKAVDRVMGPLYYSTFVIIFIFYLMNLGVGMLCNWLSYCQTSDDIDVDTAMGDYFWNSFRSLLGMRHESQDADDEAPLPDHFVNETLQRTDTVLQEVDLLTNVMYRFECKKRGSKSTTDSYA
ncbi:polycystin-1-like protein 2 [Branchiostoma floridae x Branchiostoma belcheri]